MIERRAAPSFEDRLAEIDRQIERTGDPSGLLARIRKVTVSEHEALQILGRRAADRAAS